MVLAISNAVLDPMKIIAIEDMVLEITISEDITVSRPSKTLPKPQGSKTSKSEVLSSKFA
jgi:hypothetical protein